MTENKYKNLSLAEKEKYKKAIEILLENIIEEANNHIEVEDFGKCITGGSYESFVFEFLKNMDIDIEEDLKENFDDVLSIINENNYYNLEQLEIVEEDIQPLDRADDKYVYTNIIVLYKADKTHHEFLLKQTSGRDNVSLSLEYIGKVEKQEIVSYKWIKS